MRALVMTVTNPFDPLGSRSLRQVRRPSRVRALAPRTDAPFMALMNGRPLLRAGWRRRIRPGDQLVFVILPRGGGGGGSNPLRMVLSLAVMAFAPFAAAGLLGGGLTAATVGTTLIGKLTVVGLTLAGNALVNALLPMQRPGQSAPSPTYTLSAQGNAARIDQPIPVHYGRVLAYPDFAAQPYTEFAGDEQYLYQLLCLGSGEFEIEQIRIEDTPIDNFTEISTQIVQPGGQVTLFPTQVISSVEVSGQEFLGQKTATWARSATTVTVTETAHARAVGQAVALDFTSGGGPSGVYQIATVPGPNSFTVTTATGSGSGNVAISGVIGGIDGFVASPAGSVATRIAFDIVLPAGLHDLSSGSGKLKNRSVSLVIEARRVDDDGLPLAGWITLGSETLTDRTTTPLRRSLSYPLDVAGRYRVRAWRPTGMGGEGHTVIWVGLRSYLTEVQDFGQVTLIALRMRATNNLSAQSSRRIGVIATRKLPVWNGSVWSAPQPTRSIAWALADAARNTLYGAALPDQRVDLAALLALDAVWTARGDRFDGRFDQAGSWWDAASKIVAVGRARPFLQGGILRVVRDGPADLPVALYSMRNISRGSFSIDWLLNSDDTADAVEVSYFDAALWQQRRVTARLPGSSGAKPVKMDIFGITEGAHALREGLYHAAANKYRRTIMQFSTEMEGFIPSIGDTIAVQHDMPGWGVHAEAVAWDPATRRLTLTEPMTFGTGAHYVGLRTATGALSTPYVVTPGPSPEIVVLAEIPDPAPLTGPDRERSHVVFGTIDTWRTLAKVIWVRPRSMYEVEIEAVAEDPSVHTADLGAVAPPLITSLLPRQMTAPVVGKLYAQRVPDDAIRAVFSWQPAPGAEIYQIEMAEGDDTADPDVSWTRAGDTTASHYVLALLYAARTMIRVRGVGLTAGPWRAANLGALIPDMWNTNATPMWTADSNAMWSVP